jgi:putative thioredoxin
MAMDVVESNFEQFVLEASHHVPVLVDFWAEWCGPCRMLGPVLEKIEIDMNGAFSLVKVDTDKEQGLARKFQISGIPAVKLFVNGQVVDQFTGALPEPNVRKFLERNMPDPRAATLLDLSQSDPLEAARQALDIGLSANSLEDLLWRALPAAFEQENEILSRILDKMPPGKNTEACESLRAFLQRNPDSQSKTYISRLLKGDAEPALNYFLDQVEAAPKAERLNKKDDVLMCFLLLGNSNPLTNTGRRRLSSLLY